MRAPRVAVADGQPRGDLAEIRTDRAATRRSPPLPASSQAMIVIAQFRREHGLSSPPRIASMRLRIVSMRALRQHQCRFFTRSSNALSADWPSRARASERAWSRACWRSQRRHRGRTARVAASARASRFMVRRNSCTASALGEFRIGDRGRALRQGHARRSPAKSGRSLRWAAARASGGFFHFGF